MAVRRNIMVDSTQGLHEAGHFWPRLTKSLLACVILPVSTDLGSERLSSCAFCPVSDMTPVGMIFCSATIHYDFMPMALWGGSLLHPPQRGPSRGRSTQREWIIMH